MAEVKRPDFLRLVKFQPPMDPVAKESFVRPAWQTTLFANEHPALLLFVDLDRLGGEDFLRLLAQAGLRHIFDLRRAPRFDLGPLNRRTAFARMKDAAVLYHDLSGLLGKEGVSDVGAVANLVRKAASDKLGLNGPLAFFVDRSESNEAFLTALTTALGAPTSGVWDVMLVPFEEASEDRGSRPLVFVSHANPEDNEFVKWLASQLSVSGYEVWSDVTKLVGGEEFWSDIEAVIRDKAGAVVVVLSKVAQRKAGVLDEIDLAVWVERSRGLRGFVIPLRVDDLAFGDVRANLARKNIIDFHQNWATGLRALLLALEKAGVPHLQKGQAAAGAAAAQRERGAITNQTETILTNWMPITSLPPHITFWDVGGPIDALPAVAMSLDSPWQRYLRLIATFGTDAEAPVEAAGIVTTPSYSISVEELREHGSKEPPIAKAIGRNLILNLMRQAWDRDMTSRGLLPHPNASGALIWFPPLGRWPNDRGSFKDNLGKYRYRALVGWSARRKVYWHAGVDAKPVLGDLPKFILRQHVIFTEDGFTPLQSSVRMHALRRSFCRSWWNDRWRDLLAAYVGTLEINGQLVVAAGRGTTIVCGPLMKLDAHFAPSSDLPVLSGEEELAGDDLDADDDMDEWFENDFDEEQAP